MLQVTMQLQDSSHHDLMQCVAKEWQPDSHDTHLNVAEAACASGGLVVGCWPRPQQLKRPGGRLLSIAGVDGLPRLLNLPSTAITHATAAPVMAQKHAVVCGATLLCIRCRVCLSREVTYAGCSTWEAVLPKHPFPSLKGSHAKAGGRYRRGRTVER